MYKRPKNILNILYKYQNFKKVMYVKYYHVSLKKCIILIYLYFIPYPYTIFFIYFKRKITYISILSIFFYTQPNQILQKNTICSYESIPKTLPFLPNSTSLLCFHSHFHSQPPSFQNVDDALYQFNHMYPSI